MSDNSIDNERTTSSNPQIAADADDEDDRSVFYKRIEEEGFRLGFDGNGRIISVNGIRIDPAIEPSESESTAEQRIREVASGEKGGEEQKDGDDSEQSESVSSSSDSSTNVGSVGNTAGSGSKSRRLVLAPSGSGKSTWAKGKTNVVDLDSIIEWPTKDRWWEDEELAKKQNDLIQSTINEWLGRPGNEIGLYADDVGGRLKADLVVIVDDKVLERNLKTRTDGKQPGIESLDKIKEGARVLASKYPSNKLVSDFEAIDTESSVNIDRRGETKDTSKVIPGVNTSNVKVVRNKEGESDAEARERTKSGERQIDETDLGLSENSNKSQTKEVARCQDCKRPKTGPGGSRPCRC